MQPALLVLAAGMGSRYGGLKQIDPVGPHGETLLDYSVYDALRAGFGRVVFVIRRDFEALFREKIGARYADRIAVDYVFQSLDALPSGHHVPAGREKPWGTGHATWCARDAIQEPFAVINADDFYGAESFRKLAEFLQQARPDEAAMAGFQLARTLSENGSVSRGLCDVGPGNILRSVTEQSGIEASEVGPGKKFPENAIVSMNCWGFTPDFFPLLDARFHDFLRSTPPDALAAKAEFYLPGAVSQLIAEDKLRVRVLTTGSDWFGVTYRDDRPRVTTALQALIAARAYPEKLF